MLMTPLNEDSAETVLSLDSGSRQNSLEGNSGLPEHVYISNQKTQAANFEVPKSATDVTVTR